MSLAKAIDRFLAKSKFGKKADYNIQQPDKATVRLQDDSDGDGPFIAYWDQKVLGPWPTEADGFTAEMLRKAPKS